MPKQRLEAFSDGVIAILITIMVLRTEGDSSLLAAAIGADIKGKASLPMYGLGIGLSFADRWLGIAVYIAVALMWLIPDRRVERTLTRAHQDAGRISPR